MQQGEVIVERVVAGHAEGGEECAAGLNVSLTSNGLSFDARRMMTASNTLATLLEACMEDAQLKAELVNTLQSDTFLRRNPEKRVSIAEALLFKKDTCAEFIEIGLSILVKEKGSDKALSVLSTFMSDENIERIRCYQDVVEKTVLPLCVAFRSYGPDISRFESIVTTLMRLNLEQVLTFEAECLQREALAHKSGFFHLSNALCRVENLENYDESELSVVRTLRRSLEEGCRDIPKWVRAGCLAALGSIVGGHGLIGLHALFDGSSLQMVHAGVQGVCIGAVLGLAFFGFTHFSEQFKVSRQK